jgi:hypothetical protein
MIMEISDNYKINTCHDSCCQLDLIRLSVSLSQVVIKNSYRHNKINREAKVKLKGL